MMISVTIQRKGRAGVTLQMEYRTHVKPTSSNDTIKQMTSTWRSKINAYNIIQRNLIRQIYKYTIKKYIQIHNKECTEISPRDSCFAQWGSSDESRDHCAAKIPHWAKQLSRGEISVHSLLCICIYFFVVYLYICLIKLR